MKRTFLLFLLLPALALSAPAAQTPAPPAPNPDSLRSVSGKDTANLPDSAKNAKAKKKTEVRDTLGYLADMIDYDMKGKILYLNGHALVTYQDIRLVADSITYRIDNDLFYATGSPQLVEGGDTTVGESMSYNIKTRRGSVSYASTHMADASFNAQSIVKGADNSFYSQNGDYTTCQNAEDPHYYFYARDIKVLPNDKIIARPAVFNIAQVPVGALPYFILPLQRQRSSGILTPSFGGNPASGGYLDNIGYYWAPNDYADFVLSSRISEFRDFLVTASSHYVLRYWLDGAVTARYALNTDYFDRSNLWSIGYAHNQNLTPDGLFRLSGSGNLESSKRIDVLHSESTPDLIRQTANANLALTKVFPSINASAGLTWRRSQDFSKKSLDEDIPSASFTLPSRPLIPEKPQEQTPGPNGEIKEPAWYHKVMYSYNVRGIRKHRVQPYALVDTEWTHSGIEQGASFSYSQPILKYLNIRPYFDANMYALDAYKDTTRTGIVHHEDTLYDTAAASSLLDPAIRARQRIIDTLFYADSGLGELDTNFVVIDTILRDSNYTYPYHDQWQEGYAYHAGVSFSTTLYGLFPVRIMNFAGLRHVMTPSISFDYRPKSTSPDKRFYDIGISPYLANRQSRTVNLGLGNEFQGKTIDRPAKEGEKPRENKFHLLSLGLSTSYDFDDLNNDNRKWSNLSLNAGTSSKLVSVGFGSSFWLYDQNNKLTIPILQSYSVSFNPQINFAASGTLWSGDLRDFTTGISTGAPPDPAPGTTQTWQATLRPSYGFSGSRQSPDEPFVTTKSYSLSASASVSFTKRWSASWDAYYNFVTNQLVGHSFNFSCDLECFDMRFNWRPSGINEGYYFIVQIKKIPDIKWEKKP